MTDIKLVPAPIYVNRRCSCGLNFLALPGIFICPDCAEIPKNAVHTSPQVPATEYHDQASYLRAYRELHPDKCHGWYRSYYQRHKQEINQKRQIQRNLKKGK